MTDDKTARLDAFAKQIATDRPQVPQLAALEQQLTQQFALLAPDSVSQHAAGAAWLIAANLLHPLADEPASTILNLLRLAGQRLYQGEDVRLEQPCPHSYSSGAPCRFAARATSQEQLVTFLNAHIDLYHPGAVKWLPDPMRAEAETDAPAVPAPAAPVLDEHAASTTWSHDGTVYDLTKTYRDIDEDNWRWLGHRDPEGQPLLTLDGSGHPGTRTIPELIEDYGPITAVDAVGGAR